MQVSILIPYIRPENIEQVMHLAVKNAGIPAPEIQILAEYDQGRVGCPLMVKRLVSRASGSYLCFIGDDTRPLPGYLKHAIDQMALLPDGWGLVGFDDLSGRILPTHFLADRRVLDLLGGELFHTGYRHCFCDNELMDRLTAKGRFLYSKLAVVLHDNPIVKGTEITGEYAKIYHSNQYVRDQMLYFKRKKGGFPNEKHS